MADPREGDYATRPLHGEHPGTCVFCAIVRGQEPAVVVREWDEALAFHPLDPVTDGHLLVIPKRHVSYATENPVMAGFTFQCAAEIAPTPSNLITSSGGAATQSVFHLHVHVVPRHEGDGLTLPWTPRQEPDKPSRGGKG